MMDKSVVVIDRTDAVNTLMKLPNKNVGKEKKYPIHCSRHCTAGTSGGTLNMYCIRPLPLPTPIFFFFSLGQNAFGEEIRFTSNDTANPGVEVPLNVVTNLFCSAGQLLADGSLLSVGESTDSSAFDPYLQMGRYSIRSYSSPCLAPSCSFSLLGNMTDRRWYPTTQVMPDGRVLIVGGTNTTGNVCHQQAGIDNPTVEYWPRRPNEGACGVRPWYTTIQY